MLTLLPMRNGTTVRARLGHVVMSVVLAGSACASGTATAEPATQRIIPLDGDVAEIVFALGKGDNVVATDLSATYPPEADALPEIGYQRALSAETIATYEPTLLIGTDIAGPPEAIADLERLGYPLVIVPSTPTREGPAEKIRAVAAALDVDGEGLAQSVTEAIDELDARSKPTVAPKVGVLYLRGTSAQLVLGSNSAPHWLIEAAGGIDIADELGITDPTDISAEGLIVVAPDALLVTNTGLASVGGIDGLLEIGGISQTPAGKNRAIYAYDDQMLLGNGPRTPQMLAQLIDDLAEVTPESSPEQ